MNSGLSAFFFPPSHEHIKGFLSERTLLNADLLYDHQIYRLQACVSTFQAGTYTGWGSEGVKAADTMTYIRFSLADAQPDGIVVGTVRCSV